MRLGTSAPALTRDPHIAPVAARAAARDFLELTRPRVVVLAVLAGGPVLLLHRSARDGILAPLAILVGIVLVGAACSVLNAWIERDRDALMARTRHRPLPAGRVGPAEALVFGLALSAAGVAVLGVWGGTLAAVIGALTIAWYIAIYTLWAKPRTSHNTVLGAFAGAAAPLIASVGMLGRIDGFSWALFAIVFAWQPPHVWAITLFRGAEYRAAGIVMLPAVAGERVTRACMLVWALALVPVSLMPWRIGALGPAYAATALALSAAFAASVVRAARVRTVRADRHVLFASLLYLTVLFAEMLAELAFR